MLRIGEFSRIAQVTIITLRHYDQVGLLKPGEIDPATGYRYYSIDQLPRLHRILLLKDFGFNLNQIGQLLDENLPVEQMVGMLKLKRAEVEQQVAQEQSRLAQIEARLNLIQNENQLLPYEILVKSVEPLSILFIQDRLADYAQVSSLWRELKAYLRKHRMGWDYPSLALWQEIEYQEQDIAVEAAVPFDGTIPLNARIQMKVLPEVKIMACTIHQGDYIGLAQAYEALIRWTALNDYRLNAPVRELYMNYDRNNPQANITQIQLPLEKARPTES